MKGRRFFKLYDVYEPYFYIDAPEGEKEAILSLSASDKGRTIKASHVEVAEKKVNGKPKKLLKVFCKHPFDVPVLRKALADYNAYEHRIPFGRRYLIDKGLAPFSRLTYEREGKMLKKILKQEEKPIHLKALAFDIETYNPQGSPRPMQDPAIMISYAGKEAGVFTYRKTGKKFCHELRDEEACIEAFCKELQKQDVELLLGYNSSVFDIPYLKARSEDLKVPLKLGRDGSSFRMMKKGLREAAKITGRIHVDLYPVVRFMGTIGAFKVSKFTLENAYAEITGKKKTMVKRLDIWRMWDSDEERKELAEYSLHDAEVTKEIGERVIPIEVELSRVARLPLFDTTNATTGQLVESLLMHRSYESGAIIPNRPKEDEVKKREFNPIEGAFVKLPLPGIYENLVVFDFRGLYPSIITSHNIDPYTLNCKCCRKEESHVSPLGHRFCKKEKGLIPAVLEELIDKRAELKKKLKTAKKGSDEHTMLFSRSQALKVLTNSFYGYLAYARSRWYSREAGESVTAWGRQYIQDTMKKAEDAGFEVLYADTDSVFIVLHKKTKEDALHFMKQINDELPDRMELELEGFYPRGVFVTKKGGEGKGAKKKYALIADDGSIKIRGFELVRRDWSNVAKDTQRAVLEAILKHGSKEMAVKIVKDMIEKLKSGQVAKEDLVIYTQIRKDPHKYDIVSPETSAAKKAISRGVKLDIGSIIGYIVTSKGASISDKAELAEFAKDYDANYYIEHQVLPSVLKILKELGYNEDDLKFKGTQKGLGEFF